MSVTLRFAVAICFSFAGLGSFALAALSDDTIGEVGGAHTVSAEETDTLLRRGAKVFDVRSRASFSRGHLDGAVNIGEDYDSATKEFDPRVFGEDKDAVIVIYGQGCEGMKGYYAASSLVSAGYRNVNWLRCGMSEWAKAGFPIVAH